MIKVDIVPQANYWIEEQAEAFIEYLNSSGNDKQAILIVMYLVVNLVI